MASIKAGESDGRQMDESIVSVSANVVSTGQNVEHEMEVSKRSRYVKVSKSSGVAIMRNEIPKKRSPITRTKSQSALHTNVSAGMESSRWTNEGITASPGISSTQRFTSLSQLELTPSLSVNALSGHQATGPQGDQMQEYHMQMVHQDQYNLQHQRAHLQQLTQCIRPYQVFTPHPFTPHCDQPRWHH